MALSPRSLKGLRAAGRGSPALLAAPGCVDIVGADMNRYVERDEKHFTVSGKPDVALTTFDGSIEIRPWDKPDVEVVIEKRGRDHADVAEIEVKAEQHGNRIEVSIVQPKRDRGFNLHFHNRSARLIVSMPASSDVSAKSGDGSIDIERIAGRVAAAIGRRQHPRPDARRRRRREHRRRVNQARWQAHRPAGAHRRRQRHDSRRFRQRARRRLGHRHRRRFGDARGARTASAPSSTRTPATAASGMHDVTLSNVTGTIGKNTVRGRLGAGGRAVKVRTGDGSITLRKS